MEMSGICTNELSSTWTVLSPRIYTDSGASSYWSGTTPRLEQELFLKHRDDISIKLYIILIFVPPSPQFHSNVQVDYLRLWDASFILNGQVTVDAWLSPDPEGEYGGELTRSPPEGMCANRGVRGNRGVSHCGGLAIRANRPQVEEEARYEPISRLRRRERERGQQRRTLTSTPKPILH